MVLAFILSRLGAGRWRVAGVHIDYGNRPESGAEADFVATWCAEQGVVFRLKRIEELRRGIAGRDEYERESRRIRYDFYAACLAEFAGCGGVCVGHHAGDVQENVITNLLKGTSLLAVSGMAEVSTVNGIPVWCVLAAAQGDACTLGARSAFARVQAAAAALGEGCGIFVRAPLRRAVLSARVWPAPRCSAAGSSHLRCSTRQGHDTNVEHAREAATAGAAAPARSVRRRFVRGRSDAAHGPEMCLLQE